MVKHVILDTSFILTAIRNKIDFIDEIILMGLLPIVPKQVIEELNGILTSKKKLKFREEAKIAIQFIDKKKVKTIDLKTSNVDRGLIDYAKTNKGTIIATLDREVKKAIINNKLVIRRKTRLEVI